WAPWNARSTTRPARAPSGTGVPTRGLIQAADYVEPIEFAACFVGIRLARFLRQPHGPAVGATNLVRLARLEDEVVAPNQPRCALAKRVLLRQRVALHEVVAADDGQRHARVLHRVAKQRL